MQHMLTVAEESADYAAKTLALSQGHGSLVDAVATVQADTRLRHSVELQALVQDSNDLADYADGAGQEAVASYRDMFPDTKTGAVATPTEIGKAVRGNAASDTDMESLANFVANLSVHAGGESSMHSYLDKAFAEMNMSIMRRDCADQREPKAKARFCRVAGMCLCGHNGRLLFQIPRELPQRCHQAAREAKVARSQGPQGWSMAGEVYRFRHGFVLRIRLRRARDRFC